MQHKTLMNSKREAFNTSPTRERGIRIALEISTRLRVGLALTQLQDLHVAPVLVQLQNALARKRWPLADRLVDLIQIEIFNLAV